MTKRKAWKKKTKQNKQQQQKTKKLSAVESNEKPLVIRKNEIQ